MRVVEIETHDHLKRYVVIDEAGIFFEPIVRYLKYLDHIGSARQTLRSYAFTLKHYWEYLTQQQLNWQLVTLDDLSRFVLWLKLPSGSLKVLPVHPHCFTRDLTRGEDSCPFFLHPRVYLPQGLRTLRPASGLPQWPVSLVSSGKISHEGSGKMLAAVAFARKSLGNAFPRSGQGRGGILRVSSRRLILWSPRKESVK